MSALALPGATYAQLPCSYDVEVAEGWQCSLGQGSVVFRGLNSEARAVGEFLCPASPTFTAVQWSFEAGLQEVALPAWINDSAAIDITDDGAIVGNFRGIDGFGTLGFVFDTNTEEFTPIFPLKGGNWVEPEAINSSRVVVGAWVFPPKAPNGRAFRWQNGILEDISGDLPLAGNSWARDVNDAGVVVGYMGSTTYPPNTHGFIWNEGAVMDLGTPFPNCFATEATGINSQGQVCGIWYRTADQHPFFDRRAFLWDGTKMIDLGEWNDYRTIAPEDIGDDGTIIGYVNQASIVGGQGFAWRDGQFVLLTDAIQPDTELNYISVVFDVTADGRIAGYGGVTGSTVGVILSPIAAQFGDVNCDSSVDVDDLLEVIQTWGACNANEFCATDFNNDGAVNHIDLMIVITNWG